MWDDAGNDTISTQDALGPVFIHGDDGDDILIETFAVKNAGGGSTLMGGTDTDTFNVEMHVSDVIETNSSDTTS